MGHHGGLLPIRQRTCSQLRDKISEFGCCKRLKDMNSWSPKLSANPSRIGSCRKYTEIDRSLQTPACFLPDEAGIRHTAAAGLWAPELSHKLLRGIEPQFDRSLGIVQCFSL